jgi:hypothetical protein
MSEFAVRALAKHPVVPLTITRRRCVSNHQLVNLGEVVDGLQFCNERQCEAQPSADGLLKRWPVRADGIVRES